jgi:hypothetical protein
VAGRWFGVRGRRFVRPTLTVSHKDAEVRALADLEHKPWAAEDGEVWTAAFSVDDGLDGAREIELSVAPDITVELRRKGRKLARPGDTLAAGALARSSRVKNEVIVEVPDNPGEGSTSAGDTDQPARTPRRRPSPSLELERLGARLAAANHALEQERERRTAIAKSLEDERTTNRQLRTELGQAKAELEVAAAARVEATAMEAELEEARRQRRDAQRQHEAEIQALTQRHEEATQALMVDHQQVDKAHAALQAELSQHAAALEAMREALAAERAESGRLRNRLAQIQEARRLGAAGTRARPAGGGKRAGGAEGAEGAGARGGAEGTEAAGDASVAGAAVDAGGGGASDARNAAGGSARSPEARQTEVAATSEARVSRRATSRPTRGRREPDPTETQRFDMLSFEDETETAPPRPSRRAQRAARHQTPEPPSWTPPVAERLRPLNPSLRHRTWWLGRLVALLVLCGVIAAVWIVLHSTVLH